MVTEPLHLKSCWIVTHLCSASDQLITTQLNRAQIGVPLLMGARGALSGDEWILICPERPLALPPPRLKPEMETPERLSYS